MLDHMPTRAIVERPAFQAQSANGPITTKLTDDQRCHALRQEVDGHHLRTGCRSWPSLRVSQGADTNKVSIKTLSWRSSSRRQLPSASTVSAPARSAVAGPATTGTAHQGFSRRPERKAGQPVSSPAEIYWVARELADPDEASPTERGW